MFKKNKILIIGIIVFFASILAPEFGLNEVPFLPVRFLFLATAAVGMALVGRWVFVKGKQKDFFFLKVVGGFLIGIGLMILWIYVQMVIMMVQQGTTDIDNFMTNTAQLSNLFVNEYQQL